MNKKTDILMIIWILYVFIGISIFESLYWQNYLMIYMSISLIIGFFIGIIHKNKKKEKIKVIKYEKTKD